MPSKIKDTKCIICFNGFGWGYFIVLVPYNPVQPDTFYLERKMGHRQLTPIVL